MFCFFKTKNRKNCENPERYFYQALSKYFFRALHEQLDDDNDGTIEPSETGDFIREDLQYRGSNDKQQQQMRQKKFHGQVNTTANKTCSMGRADRRQPRAQV